jgi:hypothetical protein
MPCRGQFFSGGHGRIGPAATGSSAGLWPAKSALKASVCGLLATTAAPRAGDEGGPRDLQPVAHLDHGTLGDLAPIQARAPGRVVLRLDASVELV